MIPRRKFTGAKHITETVDLTVGQVIGERSKGNEARPEGLVERLEVRMPVWAVPLLTMDNRLRFLY